MDVMASELALDLVLDEYSLYQVEGMIHTETPVSFQELVEMVMQAINIQIIDYYVDLALAYITTIRSILVIRVGGHSPE